MTQRQCPKCDGSGLIPFYNKQGILVPHCYTFCDCHLVYGLNPEPEHYRPLKAEDIDYAVSYDWRSHFEEQITGKPLPGIEPPEPEKPPEQVIIHRHSDMSKQDYDTLQQTSRQVKNLQSQIDEITKKRKPVRKQTGYKGLKIN